VAEGVTAGLVAARLGAGAGRQRLVPRRRGGLRQHRLKTEFLAVPQELLDEHGAVSAAAAEAMAVGCRSRFGTDLAVSTVGVAGRARQRCERSGWYTSAWRGTAAAARGRSAGAARGGGAEPDGQAGA